MFHLPVREIDNFRSLYRVELHHFVKRKKFSRKDLEKFLYIFHHFCNEKRKKIMPIQQFDDMIRSTIKSNNDFHFWRVLLTLRGDIKWQVTPEHWIKTMELFYCSSMDEKLKHCFSVYDANGTDFIAREDMQNFLKDCFTFDTPKERAEATNDFIMIILDKFKAKEALKISYKEYAEEVKRTPLMMHFLGDCLPEMGKNDFFEVMMKKNISK